MSYDRKEGETNPILRPSHISQDLWDNLTDDLKEVYSKYGYGAMKWNRETGKISDVVYIPPSPHNDSALSPIPLSESDKSKIPDWLKQKYPNRNWDSGWKLAPIEHEIEGNTEKCDQLNPNQHHQNIDE